MHDAYQRFKTRRAIYDKVGSVVDFFSGKGYKELGFISKRKMLNGAFSKTKNKVELFPKVHYFSAQHQK